MADSLATSASNFKVPLPPKFRYDVEVKYRPSIPDNVKHWKIFEDDLEIKNFLETFEEFSEMHIDQDSVSEERLDEGDFLNKITERNIVQLPSNHIPRGLVPLKRIFDRNDVSLKGEIQRMTLLLFSTTLAPSVSPSFSNCQEFWQMRKGLGTLDF